MIPAESVRKARQFRARVQMAIWTVSHLSYFVAVVLVAIAWPIVRRHKVNRRRKSSPRDKDGGELGNLQEADG